MILKFFNAIQLFPFRLLVEGGGGSVYHVTQDEFSSVPMDEPEGYYYRPQRSWGKVMFLQASVILLTGGGEYLTRYTPPGPGTPPGTRYTPRDQVPPLGPGTPPPRTRYPPRDQVHRPPGPGTHPPPGPGTPPRDQVTPVPPRARYTPPQTRYPPWDQVPPLGPGTPPGTRYPPWDQGPPLGPGTPPRDQVPPPGQVQPPPGQVHPPRPGTPPGTRYHPSGTRYPPQTRYPPLGPGTPPGTRYTPPGTRYPPPPGQVHPPPGTRYTPPRDQVPPPAPGPGRYGLYAGGTHPTGMHSCYYYFQRFRRTSSKTSQRCHMFSFQEGINTGGSNARMYPRSKKASRAQLARSRVRLMRSDSVETPQEVKPTKKSSSSLRSKLSGAARWFSRKFKRKMFRMTCK